MNRTVRALVALAVITAAGACGDDGGSDGNDANGNGDALSAPEWAREACQAQFDFEEAVTAAVNAEQAALDAAGADLEAQRQAVLALLDTALAEADAATESIDALGVPDVEAGEEALQVATDRFAAVRTILEDASTQLQALPVTDPAAFEAGANAISQSIGAGFQALAESLPDVGTSDELREALDTECGAG